MHRFYGIAQVPAQYFGPFIAFFVQSLYGMHLHYWARYRQRTGLWFCMLLRSSNCTLVPVLEFGMLHKIVFADCIIKFCRLNAGSEGEMTLQTAERAFSQGAGPGAGSGVKKQRGFSRCKDCNLLGHTAKG